MEPIFLRGGAVFTLAIWAGAWLLPPKKLFSPFYVDIVCDFDLLLVIVVNSKFADKIIEV